MLDRRMTTMRPRFTAAAGGAMDRFGTSHGVAKDAQTSNSVVAGRAEGQEYCVHGAV